PVFLAMNRLGQEQTGGELGDFCVRCHAPVAHRLGLTHDGLNLSELPAAVRGVTCYACHTVDGVERLHNNGLTVADDEVMRGGLRAPAANPAHPSAYSELHDSTEPSSA